jgi:hypothetical protein
MIAVVLLPLLVVLASAASADGAAPVVLDGDSEITSAVEHALADRKVRAVPAAAEAVRVHLQPDPSGIRLSIHDRNGHVVERIVANAEIAAAVVESWLRDDLARPLLEPHEIAATEVKPMGVAPVLPRSPASAHRGASSGASVTVTGGISLATDGSLWIGAGLGACVRVRSLCIGLEVQVAGDTTATGNIGARYRAVSDSSSASCNEQQQRELNRLGADALFTADLPLRIGAGTLGPGIGLGANWLSTTAVLGDHGGNATTVGPRAETRILLSWPVAWGLAADVGLWADILPFAHRKHLAANGFDLPTEPLGFLRAGLGLRYGPLLPTP